MIARQNEIYRGDLLQLEESLRACVDVPVAVRHVRIVLSASSARMPAIITGQRMAVQPGAFRMDSVLQRIFASCGASGCAATQSGYFVAEAHLFRRDVSYNLSNSPQGQLNAFEEHLVRSLTAKLARRFPPEITLF